MRTPGALLGLLVLEACWLSPVAAWASQCTEAPTSLLIVNVTAKGAKGDGRTDDTAAIQAAIDAIGETGGTVLVPKGTYIVDAVGENRLTLKSDMTLKLSSGATLKAIPNNSEHYVVLSISDVSNVTVVGGRLVGERDEHRGKSGEWGMGIYIGRGAKHITISGVISTKMWGDGFYVQDATDVKFCSVTADSNRRQGLSIIDADGLLVKNSVFKNTRGTRPSAGIDLEPDEATQEIINVRIENSKFFDNAGSGILIAGKKGPISNVEIKHNVFSGGRPMLVENAPSLAASICNNRYIGQQSEPQGDLNAFADPVDVVALQSDCGDSSFVVSRQKAKHKKSK